MRNSVELMVDAYDRIADDYDRQSVHLREPQRRLTAALGLVPGLQCVDLGCGTGVDTLDMLQLVAPGEVVAVDCSPGMLATATRRAQAAGYRLTTRRQRAEDFIHGCDDARFDVITLRFCLGYLDWRTTLPALPRMVRPRGRIGLLTNLACSAHQAYVTYRKMVDDLGLPEVSLTAPGSIEEIEAQLTHGGATIEQSWTHSFRLWFSTGTEVATWLRESGLATHPALQSLPANIVDALWRGFADRMEVHREARGLPLDFTIAGMVATVN